MKKLIVLVSLLLNACVLNAQTNKTVVPSGFADKNGNIADSIFSHGFDFQEIIRSSSLSPAWPTPVLITGIAFRLPGGVSSMNTLVSRIEIRLSTTSVAPEQITTSWFSNRGSDAKTVFFHDNVLLTAAGGQAVNPFEIQIHFDQPFIYDPSTGNLAMELRTTDPGFGSRTIDAYGFGSLNSATPIGAITESFNGPVGYGLISEFSWTVVPEPQTWCLGIFGLLAVCTVRHKTKSI